MNIVMKFLLALSFSMSSGGIAFAVGGDIRVGTLDPTVQYDPPIGNAEIIGVATGTVSCNVGDRTLDWKMAPDSRHPVIAMNLYRIKDGRFEQIGQSWVKHGFFAVQADSECGGRCIPHNGYDGLGVGCSDPYPDGLNHDPSRLGPRSKVNPFTGAFDGATAIVNDQAAGTLGHGIQVKSSDLGNPNSRYFIEAHYITADDAVAGNGNDNASYREIRSNQRPDGRWIFPNVGKTVQGKSAIMAWDDARLFIHDSKPHDGEIIVGSKSVQLSNGKYRYDYVIYNMNSAREVGSFSVPVGTATVGELYFHAPTSHGEQWSGEPWQAQVVDGFVKWATESFSQNPLANAVRWGTAYTFSFESKQAPVKRNAVVKYFRPDSGDTEFAPIVEAPGQ